MAVLAREQGVQKALAAIAIFVDMINLRSGQNLDEALWR